VEVARARVDDGLGVCGVGLARLLVARELEAQLVDDRARERGGERPREGVALDEAVARVLFGRERAVVLVVDSREALMVVTEREVVALVDAKRRTYVSLAAPRLVSLRDGIVRVQSLVAEELEEAAVEGVRAGLRDDVYDRAARAPELGGEAILVDLKLLHGLFTELVGRAHAAAPERLTEEGVVVVNAVNLEAVECAALPADGEVAAARVAYDAGRERREVLKVSA